MANPRVYEIVTGVEASPQPDAGTPSDPNDVVTLSFLATATGRHLIGTKAAPTDVGTGGLTIPALEAYEHDVLAFVQGNGGAIDITNNPQIIHTLSAGDRVELRGCSDTNTLKLDNGTGLALNSNSVVLKAGSVLGLYYNGTDLEERFRNGIEG